MSAGEELLRDLANDRKDTALGNEILAVLAKKAEAGRLLRLCIPSLKKDGRPHAVMMVQAWLSDIKAVSTAPREGKMSGIPDNIVIEDQKRQLLELSYELAEAERDAKRWRYLRVRPIADPSEQFITGFYIGTNPDTGVDPEICDLAVDQAIAAAAAVTSSAEPLEP